MREIFSVLTALVYMPTSGRDTLVLVVVVVGSVVVVWQVAVVGSVGYPVGDMVLTVGVLVMSVNSRTTAKAFKNFRQS